TRFFLTIGRIASLHFSLRLFGGIAMVLFIIALLYGAGPLHFYLTQHFVPDRYIYRLIAVNTFILAGLMFLSIGVVVERVAPALNGGKPRKHRSIERFLLSLFSTKNMLVAGPLIALLGVALNVGPIHDYLTTSTIGYHWVYITTGAICVLSGMQLTALGIFNYLISALLVENGGGE
ncbi:MAG: hypothetical protein GY849_13350, partial [Deltaproteobacteria bacterium]|nr:hypothetical protein [Deltaproteobacteria bacterium]